MKTQVQRLGQFKPLVVTADGEVLGGNARLTAYAQLGIKQVWVSVVKPKTLAEKLQYALSDNDVVGEYQENALREVVADAGIDASLFRFSRGETMGIDDLLNDALKNAIETEHDGRDMSSDVTDDGYIHKHVFEFDPAGFEKAFAGLARVCEQQGLQNNSEAILYLANTYAAKEN